MKRLKLVFFPFLLAILITLACDREKLRPEDAQYYAGPVMTAYDVVTLYSDSGRQKAQMRTPVQKEYENGNREFPKGLHVKFYDDSGRHNANLFAQYALFDKRANIYKAQTRDSCDGDSCLVIVENIIEGKKLRSEELYWSVDLKEVYTDEFVIITTPTDSLTGKGMRAKQDFSYYKIIEPKGAFSVSE